MKSVFISSSALELVRDQGIDIYELIVERVQDSSELVFVENSSGVAFGSIFDKSGVRGILIPDPSELHLASLEKDLRPSLVDRLVMLCSISDSGRLSLNNSWGPHYGDGFTSFYVAPIARAADFRAVCSLSSDGDVCLWTIVPRGTIDAELGLKHEDAPDLRELKTLLSEQTVRQFEESRDKDRTDSITVNLSVLPPSDFVRDRSFQEWTDNLTREQREFVFSDADHVQRLIGPAGSGKTLCLCLKAVQETEKRISQELTPKVLFLTHSWALSFEVDTQIRSLHKYASQFISVYPLLELARERIQQTFPGHTFRPVGDDSADAKKFMQNKMAQIIEDFYSSDWVTYQGSCSESFVSRVEATSEREALVWDVLNEIGSVINGAGLFPTNADERKYVGLVRNSWMMELESEQDRRAVFAIYKKLQSDLEADGLISYDQELNDFLRFLGSNAWNLARGEDGWDLVFVDEFHKLNSLERELLHYLTKKREQPPIRFATDLMQGSSSSRIARPGVLDSEATETEEFGRIVNVTLRQVHRYTPQILALANHIVKSTAEVFDLPEGSSVSAVNGIVPTIVRNRTLDAELIWTLDYLNRYNRPSTAIIVVDDREFDYWVSKCSRRFLVMRGKDDARLVSRSPQKTVVARAEDVSGLQFEHVMLVGLTDEFEKSTAPLYRQKFLSNLYTGLTRASTSVTLIYNEDNGCPDVLKSAVSQSICEEIAGREV